MHSSNSRHRCRPADAGPLAQRQAFQLVGRVGVAAHIVFLFAAASSQQHPVEHSGTMLPCQLSTRAVVCRKIVSVSTTHTQSKNWSPLAKPAKNLFLA